MMMFDKRGSSFASPLVFYLAKEDSELKIVTVLFINQNFRKLNYKQNL
jgi:hypothetical protein